MLEHSCEITSNTWEKYKKILSKEKMDFFSDLPNEIIIQQALNLSPIDIYRLCQTSPRINNALCSNDYFWYLKFNYDYPFGFKENQGSWKELYNDYFLIFGDPQNPPLLYEGPFPTFNAFTRPIVFSDELVEFFAQASLGPVVIGDFNTIADNTGYTERIPIVNSLVPLNQNLHKVLFFTKPYILGEPNPLYRVATQVMLIALFQLHAHYAQMMQSDLSLTASHEMRELLPTLLESVDPNNFRYAEFARIISAGKIRLLTSNQLESLTPEVTRVYRPLFGNNVITAQMILGYQKNMVDLARSYLKNT